MNKIVRLWLLLWVVMGSWLLVGCTVTLPLIRDPQLGGVAPATAAVAAPAQPIAYRLLPGVSQVRFIAREHYEQPVAYLDLVRGITTILTGTIALDPQRPAAVQMSPINVDLFALDMRNDELEEVLRYIYLQSDAYPLATFTPLRYEGLPEVCTGNEELTFRIVGHLSVREIGREVTFTVTAKIDNGRLVGLATAEVPMTAFGIEPPNKPNISWVENEVTLEIEFVAAPDS